tara:strand:+ start:277 stop:801 length:525 start_codon:yes stop_codon:yes gene_type:complete
MHRYLSILLYICCIWSQSYDPQTGEKVREISSPKEGNLINTHNVSFGMFDNKTGLSFFGYTYSFKKNKKGEFFIGAGTMIVGITGSVGWKQYIRMSKLSLSSTLCAQYNAHFGFTAPLVTASPTIEYSFSERVKQMFGINSASLKLGLLSAAIAGGDDSMEIGVFPFGGLSFGF